MKGTIMALHKVIVVDVEKERKVHATYMYVQGAEKITSAPKPRLRVWEVWGSEWLYLH